MYKIRMTSFSAPFRITDTIEVDSLKEGLRIVEERYSAQGFSNFKIVDSTDPDNCRITARTPGGRGGRNVAFVDFWGEEWDDV